jgi:hypothetical protein
MNKQPKNRNFLVGAKFGFQIDRLPNTTFFIQEISLPGLTIDSASEGSPFTRMYWPGDHINWDTLNISFKVDEDLKNWYEIFNWMQGLGFPENFDQYSDLKNQTDTDLDGQIINPSKRPKRKGVGAIFSDATLLISTSHNNPKIQIDFIDAWPTSLEQFNLNTANDTTEYLTCSVSFRYNYYKVSKV